MGDFNLIRSPDDRNIPGANLQYMLAFDDLIQHLDLEKLDWVFTSSSWVVSYPDTKVKVLGRPVSDHVPSVIDIGTSILGAKVFHFENYWVEFNNFLPTMALHWNSTPYFVNPAKTLAAKFK